ncbi:hypothetical protein KW785_02000 [Candidatus Parcubacteria bacterium]|nr:hypothetical protein [Candidatus Parcubacteria bacterium]
MHNDPDHPKINEEEANEIVSPENTEKLYGQEAVENDSLASSGGEAEDKLPESTDGVAEENMFPSAD